MNRSIRAPQSYISKDRASALLEKWSPVLNYTSKNVRNIDDDHTRLNTAILLENQERWCIEEANNSGGTSSAFGGAYSSDGGMGAYGGAVGNATGDSNADFYATGDARLPKILIPMIRRTFPELITNEIVGVQPMSGPVGLAFALRYKYDNAVLGGGPTNGDVAGSGTQLPYGWQAQSAGTVASSNTGSFGSTVSGELGLRVYEGKTTPTVRASEIALQGGNERQDSGKSGGDYGKASGKSTAKPAQSRDIGQSMDFDDPEIPF